MSVSSILKLGRSQGDTDFECGNGQVYDADTGTCLNVRSNPLCPDGYQWHVTQGCIPSRQAPIETTPTPTQTPIDSQYGITGQKPSRVSVCNGVFAPNGYHYIKTINGCALAVNYDSNVVGQPTQTASNPISALLDAVFGNNTNTNASGVSASGGISGFIEQNKTLLLLAGLAGGAYYLTQNKKATPKTYDRTESYKY